jgi:hypothetical protein
MPFKELAKSRGARGARAGASLREQADVTALVPRLARLAAETGPKQKNRNELDASKAEVDADRRAKKANQQDTPAEEEELAQTRQQQRSNQAGDDAKGEEGPSSSVTPMDEDENKDPPARAAGGGVGAEDGEFVVETQAEADARVEVDSVERKPDWRVYADLNTQFGNVSQVHTDTEQRATKLKETIAAVTARMPEKDQKKKREAQAELDKINAGQFKSRIKWQQVLVEDGKGKQKVEWQLRKVDEMIRYAEINDIELVVPLNCWKARGLEPTTDWAYDDEEEWREGLSPDALAAVEPLLKRAVKGTPKTMRDAQAALPMYFKARTTWDPDAPNPSREDPDRKGKYVDLEVVEGLEGTQFTCRRLPLEDQLQELAKTVSDAVEATPAGKIRHVMRQQLFHYTVDTNDEETGGAVTLSSVGLLSQPRAFGPQRAVEPGAFVQKCWYPDALNATGRDAQGHVTPEWRNTYNRCNRYRMEVARLWWKLYNFQSAETQTLVESLSGVKAERTGGALEASFDEYMVLSVISFGNEGALLTGEISPMYGREELDGKDLAKDDQEWALEPEGTKALFNRAYPDDYTEPVRADYDRTWPIVRIDHSLDWAAFSAGAGIMTNNRLAFDLMRYFFGQLVSEEELPEQERMPAVKTEGFLENTFDWNEDAWDRYLRPLVYDEKNNPNPTWEKDGADTLALVELITERIADAMPMWAHGFLTLDLVEDDEGLAADTAEIVAANDELAALHAALEKVDPNSAAASRLHCYDTQLRAAHQGKGMYRDAGSFVYHCYPSSDKAHRDLIDKREGMFDRGGLVDPVTERTIPWAHEHLMRAVTMVEQTGVADNMNYAIDKTIVMPDFGYMASVAYRQWYVEKVLKSPFGMVGWTVALQHMTKFQLSPTTSWYMQAQGLYGTVIGVEDIPQPENPLYNKLYTVEVLPEEFRVYVAMPKNPVERQASAKAGYTTVDGTLVVKVTGEHIWPRFTSTVASEDPRNPKFKTPIRYGDRVHYSKQYYEAMKKEFESDEIAGEELKRALRPYDPSNTFAAIGLVWIAKEEDLNSDYAAYGRYHPTASMLSFNIKDFPDFDKEVRKQLKKVGNLQTVPWNPNRQLDFEYLKYRNQRVGDIRTPDKPGGLETETLYSELLQYIPEPGARSRNQYHRMFNESKRSSAYAAVPMDDMDVPDDTLKTKPK